ncbi:MAG: 4-hydroxythreonine-4-phosphate dehydrogenase PdxA [Deltaproteobacteria bacterium]|nr:4-hydroxythreonine-4-phosphate dehydrogenase PdxA [Deltaproteobacteria bacterium]
MNPPIVAITMGDPAGIGPEITAKVLSLMELYDICRPVVIGSKDVMEDALRMTRRALKINTITDPSKGKYELGTIDFIDLENIKMAHVEYGKVSAECGRAAGDFIKKSIDLALNGEVDAVATCPIHKESFKLGGWGKEFVGHTEMFARLTNTEKYTMMLAHGDTRVVHVSTHVPLAEAIRLVKRERILHVIKIAKNSCSALGIPKPRVAVAGLNPHASDNGLMGREEIDEITPAIEDARKLGIDVVGPVSPDVVFVQARGGWYDIVVAMYHDQGHIPSKLSGFVFDKERNEWGSVSGVNVTLGTPIIRASVDHGVAFGKAGKGIARPESLLDAIKIAVRFAQNR